MIWLYKNLITGQLVFSRKSIDIFSKYDAENSIWDLIGKIVNNELILY